MVQQEPTLGELGYYIFLNHIFRKGLIFLRKKNSFIWVLTTAALWLSPPTLMKCFEKPVLQHVKDNIPASLEPSAACFQNPRIHRGCRVHSYSPFTRSILMHLENKKSYIRKLFVDSSSAFSAFSPRKSGCVNFSNTPQLDSSQADWVWLRPRRAINTPFSEIDEAQRTPS